MTKIITNLLCKCRHDMVFQITTTRLFTKNQNKKSNPIYKTAFFIPLLKQKLL